MTYRADHPAIAPAYDWEELTQSLTPEQLLAVAVLRQARKDYRAGLETSVEGVAAWCQVLGLNSRAVLDRWFPALT